MNKDFLSILLRNIKSSFRETFTYIGIALSAIVIALVVMTVLLGVPLVLLPYMNNYIELNFFTGMLCIVTWIIFVSGLFRAYAMTRNMQVLQMTFIGCIKSILYVSIILYPSVTLSYIILRSLGIDINVWVNAFILVSIVLGYILYFIYKIIRDSYKTYMNQFWFLI